jgi:UDPglucose 6-dehydrogenase
VTHDLVAFKRRSDLIVANHWSDELADVSGKVYMRAFFATDP